MEPKFQTSFIPKKAIESRAGAGIGSGINVVHTPNIFSVVATVIFVVTLFVAGGLFGYKMLLGNQIKKAAQDIEDARSAFQLDKIKELIDANARISSISGLLERHVAISRTFGLMENLVVKKTRFLSMNYNDKNSTPTLTIKGQVQSYNALAQQDDIFSKSQFITQPTFSNFKLGENGYISFEFNAGVSPELISYTKAITASSASGTVEVGTVSSTSPNQ